MSFSTLQLGGDAGDTIRSTSDVAYRALALGAAVALSFEADPEEIREWLRESGIDAHLTEREENFVFAQPPTEPEVANFSWRSERLMVLLWALGKLDELPPSHEQCSIGALADILPPLGDETLEGFLGSVRLRSPQQLLGAALEFQDLHALARQRQQKPGYKSDAPVVDIEVISERHRAINWVVGYCGQAWEDVTADT